MSYANLMKIAGSWQGKIPELNIPRADLTIPSGMPPLKLLKVVSTLRSILITKTKYYETPRNLDEKSRNVFSLINPILNDKEKKMEKRGKTKLFIAVAWLVFLSMATMSWAIETTSVGEGRTRQEAINNGIRVAVEQALGTLVKSDTQVTNGKLIWDRVPVVVATLSFQQDWSRCARPALQRLARLHHPVASPGLV